MVDIDMVHYISKNTSTAGVENPQPPIGGGLQYVPDIRDVGLLGRWAAKYLTGFSLWHHRVEGDCLASTTFMSST